MAKDLNQQYSSLRAYHWALLEHDSNDPYSVKLGSPWTPPTAEESSQNIVSGIATKKRRARKKNTDTDKSTEEANMTVASGCKKRKKVASSTAAAESAPLFQGDRSLAKSMIFMHETMVSREAAYAVAEGDIGRAYECVKVSLKYNSECKVTHMSSFR